MYDPTAIRMSYDHTTIYADQSKAAFPLLLCTRVSGPPSRLCAVASRNPNGGGGARWRRAARLGSGDS
eukprot:6200577-Pleurochrysis_carterae.AAC.4